MKRRGFTSVLSRLRRTADFEEDIESWWNQVLAGRLFNQVALRANIAAKLDSDLLLGEDYGNTHVFSYVAPCEQPKNAIDKAYFQVLLRQIEATNYENRAIKKLLSLCPRPSDDEELEGSAHGERRRQDPTVIKQS